jgi:hypothetical protein
MSKTVWSGCVACLLILGAAAAVAYSAQDGTLQPGQPTQARVWIQNQGEEEAVPVRIENAARPLRVDLTTIPTVTIAAGTALLTRAARQPWEYRAVRIAAGQNLDNVLNAAGADGWEATGTAITDQSGTIVIMKRPGAQ